MVAQTLAMAARVAAPFYILFAGRSMALSGQNLGLVSLAFLGADTVTNLGWGLAGDRFGFRVTFIVSLTVWAGATLLLVAAPSLAGPAIPVTALIFVAFFGLGAAQSGYMMSSQTMVLEFGDCDDMAMRLALTATTQGLMATLGPLVGGLIAAMLGYRVLFGVSIAFLAFALVVLVALVEEPRRRRGVA
jgi:MFS family permease